MDILAEIPPAYQAVSSSTVTLNNSTIKAAQVFQILHAGNIAKIRVLLGTVTTAQNVTISFQNIDTSTGDPDGTQDDTADVSTTGKTGLWIEAAIDRTVAVGDVVCVVIEWTSTQGAIQIVTNGTTRWQNGYSDTLVSTTWTKANTCLSIVAEYDDGKVYPLAGVMPGLISVVDPASNSNPDDYGLSFSLPFDCNVFGAFFGGARVGATTRDFAAALYPGTEVAGAVAAASALSGPITVDAHAVVSATSYGLLAPLAGYSLSANTRAILALTPGTTGANRIALITMGSETDMDALPGGKGFYLATRVDGGNWALTKTAVPMLSALVQPVAGSSSTVIVIED